MTKKYDGLETAATPAEVVEQIAVELIDPSPTQPRKRFDPEAMKELVASVKSHGIITPLLVRTKPGESSQESEVRSQKSEVRSQEQEGRYELVNGERRLRAGKANGLATVPCIARAMTDAEVMEIQTIEFLHHAELHPMEEARGFKALADTCKMTVDEIARRTAKPRAYILKLLKLCDLIPDAEKLFLDKKLSVETALLVARVPKDLQGKAATEVGGKESWDRQPMGTRQAREHIECNYMLRLADASFDVKSTTLVSKAGPCSTCPKRTGNDKDLFGDIKGADVCTDPTCYHEKQKQHVIQLKLRATSEGRAVIPDDEAKKLFRGQSDNLATEKYVDLDEQCWQDPKYRTYRKLLGKHVEPVLVVSPAGVAHDLMTKDRVAQALKKAGVRVTQSGSGGNDDYKRQQAAARAKRRIEEAAGMRALADVVAAAEKLDFKDLKVARWWTRKILDDACCVDAKAVVAKRRFPDVKRASADAALEKLVDTLTVPQLQGLQVELMSVGYQLSTWGQGDLGQVCKFLGINLKKIEAAVKKELAAAKVKKPAAKKKAEKKAQG